MDASALRTLIRRHADVPPGDEDPLNLDSLTLVAIVEDLEVALGRRISAREITAANFGTIAAVLRWIS